MLKSLYAFIIKSIEGFIVFLYILKTWISETIAIIRKRKLIGKVVWDKNKTDEFNLFWESNLGRKISSKGVKLYESINGIYRKDYIPDKFFAIVIEPMLNRYWYAKIYSDKSLTEILYAKSRKVIFPKTYLVSSGGIYYDGKRKIIDKERAKEIILSLKSAVIKPTTGGNSGKGVIILKNKYGCENSFNALDLIDSNQSDFIVQEVISQHISISNIYPNSVNTLRVITFIVKNQIYCADIAMRIGSGGGLIDNIHAGWLVIGVERNGTLLKYAYKLGYSESRIRFEQHPDTKILFEKYQIEGIDQIVECAIELHGYTHKLGMISWDFSVSDKGDPVLIEANYWGQSVWFTQIVHGKPIFGEHTEEILRRTRKKYE